MSKSEMSVQSICDIFHGIVVHLVYILLLKEYLLWRKVLMRECLNENILPLLPAFILIHVSGGELDVASKYCAFYVS